ncbi:MAG: hypothetical protein KAW87_01415 [Candidatus Cloacimonetes bacterium]|nr:hypothetical protein [Candidatus Cloacimonadota bacterium]
MFNNGDTRQVTYYISKDGASLRKETEILGKQISGELEYVNDKTSP